MLAVTTLAVAVRAKRRAKVGLRLRMCIFEKTSWSKGYLWANVVRVGRLRVI